MVEAVDISIRSGSSAKSHVCGRSVRCSGYQTRSDAAQTVSMTPSLSRPQTCPSRWAMARKRPSRLPVYLLVLDGCLRELTRFPRLCTPQLLSRFTPLPSEYLKEGLQSPTPEPPLGGALQRRLPPIRCWHLLPSSRDPTLTRLERRAHGAE